MNKIFTILIVIGLAFMIGCVGEKVITISELNENLANKTVVLEGTINMKNVGMGNLEGCYLTDDTGEIKLVGSKILIMETYPPQCQYEGKIARITGTYNPVIVACEGCQTTITVEKIEVIEEDKCQNGFKWNGTDCLCGENTDCPIPTVVVPNGYYEAYCENDECKTRIICNSEFELVDEECTQQSIITPPSAHCEMQGGEWKEFGNTCVDSCEYARAPEPLACGAAMTMGCDCGPDKCWNGGQCVQTDLELACTESGGTVSTGICCPGTKDFDWGPSCWGCNETIEIKVCLCSEKTAWDGTTCRDSYMEIDETEKQNCISTGGEIMVQTSIGGFPMSVEICDCGENMYWKEEGCYNPII